MRGLERAIRRLRPPICRQMKSLLRSALLLLLLFIINRYPEAAELGTGFVPTPSCMVNFRDLLPPNDHGFLKVGQDGHFHWANGARARFWGINVSSTRLDIPDAQIQNVVRTFADSGINLVRFEAIDNRGCLLGPENAPDSLHFDPHYLDRLDRWIATLKQYHICYYLDLLDLRSFKPGDGVPNATALHRGARPYAMFDPKLIQLQQQYAHDLLCHTNPYTGLKLVDDPELVMLEICNESGFFLQPDQLDNLVEPYRTELRKLWNQWLLARYGNREKLASSWGYIQGYPVLRPDEDPNNNSVDLPLLTPPPTDLPPNVIDVRHAPKRVQDGVEFLYTLERSYFHQMVAYLHGIGVKIPITAVVSSDAPADLAAVAEECDFTAENWYGETSLPDPQNRTLSYISNQDPLANDSGLGFAPYTATLRWDNKPVVIREWDVGWPNRWRSSSVPLVLAYAALQDYDAVLLFGYQTNKGPNDSNPMALNMYSEQSDPAIWGLYAIAARVFLSGLIQPAQHTVTFAFPKPKLFQWPYDTQLLARLAWCVKLNSTSHPTVKPLTVTPTGTDQDNQKLDRILAYLYHRGAPINPKSRFTGQWLSDTSQIHFDSVHRLLTVCTSSFVMIAGAFEPKKTYRIGSLCLSTTTPYGALMAIALDGKPIRNSQNLLIKMVSTAENTGQQLRRAPHGSPAPWVLLDPGHPPVTTHGQPATFPTSVWLAPTNPKGQARSLLSLHMRNGTWELHVRAKKAQLACDTPELPVSVLGIHTLTGMPSHIITFIARW